MNKKGRIFIICAPSGCGKGTVIQRLLETDPSVFLSVSGNDARAAPGEIPEKAISM